MNRSPDFSGEAGFQKRRILAFGDEVICGYGEGFILLNKYHVAVITGLKLALGEVQNVSRIEGHGPGKLREAKLFCSY